MRYTRSMQAVVCQSLTELRIRQQGANSVLSSISVPPAVCPHLPFTICHQCRVKVGDGLVGRCGLEHSEPINVYDYSADDELISMVLDPLLRGGRQTRSALVHPVFGNDSLGKVAAVILAINKREDGPEAEDMFFEDYYTEVSVKYDMACVGGRVGR